MFFTTRSAERPYHLGSFPMESLPRDDAVFAEEAARPPACAAKYNNPPKGPLAKSLRTYLDIFIETAVTNPAPVRACSCRAFARSAAACVSMRRRF